MQGLVLPPKVAPVQVVIVCPANKAHTRQSRPYKTVKVGI